MKKTAKQKHRPQRVRTYDEQYLYHLFCVSHGSVDELLKYVENMPIEAQSKIPKRTALFALMKQHKWKQRYDELKLSVQKELESDIGMPYATINRISQVVAQGYFNKMAKCLEDNDLDNFSYRDLQAIWAIQRTERGLPTNIARNFNTSERESEIKTDLENKGAKPLLERLDKLSGKDIDELLGGTDEPPNIIDSDNHDSN